MHRVSAQAAHGTQVDDTHLLGRARARRADGRHGPTECASQKGGEHDLALANERQRACSGRESADPRDDMTGKGRTKLLARGSDAEVLPAG